MDKEKDENSYHKINLNWYIPNYGKLPINVYK